MPGNEAKKPPQRARRCLLKGCERWFMPGHPRAHYCGPRDSRAAEATLPTRIGLFICAWPACGTNRPTKNGKCSMKSELMGHKQIRFSKPCPLCEPQPSNERSPTHGTKVKSSAFATNFEIHGTNLFLKGYRHGAHRLKSETLQDSRIFS